jgi:predicted outer membrane protein
MTLRNFPTIAFACLATLSMLGAQNEPQRPTGRPTDPSHTGQEPGRGMNGATSSEGDRILATCIMVANNNEIALAEHAQAKLQNPEAKQFAQMMIKDHGDFGRKLQRFSAVAPGDGDGTHRPTDANADGNRPGHTGQPGQPGQTGQPGGQTGQTGQAGGQTGRPGEHPAGERTGEHNPGREPSDATGMRRMSEGIDHVALAQELGRKKLESAEKMLDEKQGTEFDQCYMGMQIAAHACVLDELQVYANHASPELRALFTEAQSTVRSHLDRAKQIEKDLMGKSAGTGR